MNPTAATGTDPAEFFARDRIATARRRRGGSGVVRRVRAPGAGGCRRSSQSGRRAPHVRPLRSSPDRLPPRSDTGAALAGRALQPPETSRWPPAISSWRSRRSKKRSRSVPSGRRPSTRSASLMSRRAGSSARSRRPTPGDRVGAPAWERPDTRTARSRCICSARTNGRSKTCATRIECAPAFAEAHVNLSLLLLRHGRFGEAWRGLDWHDRANGEAPTRPQQLWSGSATCDRTAVDDGQVRLRRHSPVRALCSRPARQFGGPVLDRVSALSIADLVSTLCWRGWCRSSRRIERCRMQMPIMSGPARLDEIHLPATQFPAIYPAVLTHATAALVEGCSKPIRVGFAWRGNMTRSPERTCPLPEFLPLASVAGVQLFSLQFDETGEGSACCEQAGIISIGPSLGTSRRPPRSYLRLDLVITVDTSLAIWRARSAFPSGLLPENADWRWMIDRSDGPRYPTMRLFPFGTRESREARETRRCMVRDYRQRPHRFAPLRGTASRHQAAAQTLDCTRFQLKDIPLLAYDERDSLAVDHIVRGIRAGCARAGRHRLPSRRRRDRHRRARRPREPVSREALSARRHSCVRTASAELRKLRRQPAAERCLERAAISPRRHG